MYQVKEANHMIEEFMLAANIAVAEKILHHYPACALLRCPLPESSTCDHACQLSRVSPM